MSRKSRCIVWFRNDLRVADHEPLYTACKEFDSVLPVYIIDERAISSDRYGFAKTGPYRAQFLKDSLLALAQRIREKGGKLHIQWGLTEDILPALLRKTGAQAVFAHKEVTHEETSVENTLNQQVPVRWFWGSTLYHLEDIPFEKDAVPGVFTAFRKKTEKHAKVRPLIPEPERLNTPAVQGNSGIDAIFNRIEAGTPHPDTAFPFRGGLYEADKRIQNYFWETQNLLQYKCTRNGLLGTEYSSKLSPWLANGSLSPREVYHEVRKFESLVKKNISTYWLIFELIWRDYFRFIALKHGNRIFYSGGINNIHKRWKTDPELFEGWRQGRTGQTFVDANMIELARTGWMSNRGRQNVASYLTHDLGVDWRMGAAWFESMLLDYDPCSNYGNWMYVAGVGNDPRPNRVFDVEWQAKKYDPRGAFSGKWSWTD